MFEPEQARVFNVAHKDTQAAMEIKRTKNRFVKKKEILYMNQDFSSLLLFLVGLV